jgi:hypothetical protein
MTMRNGLGVNDLLLLVNKYPYSYTGKKKYLFISYDVPEMLINAQKDEDEADR